MKVIPPPAKAVPRQHDHMDSFTGQILIYFLSG